MKSFLFCFVFVQILELETENSELKKQLQDLEEQLMIAHVPPVRTSGTHTHSLTACYLLVSERVRVCRCEHGSAARCCNMYHLGKNTSIFIHSKRLEVFLKTAGFADTLWLNAWPQARVWNDQTYLEESVGVWAMSEAKQLHTWLVWWGMWYIHRGTGADASCECHYSLTPLCWIISFLSGRFLSAISLLSLSFFFFFILSRCTWTQQMKRTCCRDPPLSSGATASSRSPVWRSPLSRSLPWARPSPTCPLGY